MFVEVDGVVMQGPVARLSRTPARDALGRPRARRRHRRSAGRARRLADRGRPPARPARPPRRRPRRAAQRRSSPRIAVVATDLRKNRRHGVVRGCRASRRTGLGASVAQVASRSTVVACRPRRAARACFPRTGLVRSGSTHACDSLSDALPARCRTAGRRSSRSTPSAPALLDRATELDAAQQALGGRAGRRADATRGAARRDVAAGRSQGHRARLPRHASRRAAARSRRSRPTRDRCGASTCARPRWRSSPATHRPMTLVEIHRELHLDGYAIASRQPVQAARRLRSATRSGRAAPSASTEASTGSASSIPASAAASDASP